MEIGQQPVPDGAGRFQSGRTWLALLRSHRKTLIAAVFVALSVGLAAHLLHVGAHAGHEAALSDGIYHWLRDSALAIPMAALIIYAVNDFTRAWTSTGRLLARLRWGLMVGLGYAFALIPGGMAHGRLFPAEAHTGDAFKHALVDAVALLPASVYTSLAVVFLLGMPSESVAPVVSVFRRVRAYEWGTATWKPAPGAFARIPVALAAFLTVLPAPAFAGPDAVTQLRAPNIASTNAALSSCTGRTITADVVALDQPFYYNRLGAINANGMIYALRRDVVDNVTGLTEAEGAAQGVDVTLTPGNVSLRDDKRPRPLTLRANEGDCLQIAFTNLLDPVQFIFDLPADFPLNGLDGQPIINRQVDDQPLTRMASIHVDGLELVGGMVSDGSNVGRNDAAGGNGLVAPGDSQTYTYYAPSPGTHLLYSMGTTLGGEGNGGTRGYGLFGAVNIQPGPVTGEFAGSEWYRSQLTRQEMDWAASAWTVQTDETGLPVVDPATGQLVIVGRSPGDVPVFEDDGVTPRVVYSPDGQPLINYHAVYPADAPFGKGGLPIVEILDGNEIVHSDLNAIIDDRGFPYPPNDAYPTRGDEPYREFTVIFHDEAFGVQAFPGFFEDPVLAHTLHGVRDAFPINYGSGGIGAEIIANRLGVGPMWDCAECKYEEFFLTSFTVGDPAMIVDIPANTTNNGVIIPGAKATKALYPDDPSNVHHAYLGDRVVFRNLHAGPKEHHIFHLHAHQWQFNPDDPQSVYLDGQALGPGSGYSYEIAYGGSGNRNLTPGDSIFHCHFYPHFAQGMWELWRVHDVFERGTLLGADGRPAGGSRALPDGEIAAGTPIPGVVPMPGMAMAPMPDPAATIVASDLNDDGTDDSSQFDADGDGTADIFQAAADEIGFVEERDANGNLVVVDGVVQGRALENPGYPWFTPGLVGHRPPTPAYDMDPDMDGSSAGFDGGLPRHVVTSGPDEFDDPGTEGPDAVEMYVTRLDFNKVLHHASAVQIPEDGTAVEQVAMRFHGEPFHPSSLPIDPRGLAGDPNFETNGLPAAAGAPFADPCRTDAGTAITQNRTIKGANIEMPVVLNKVGWHFQQQRFEALWEDVVPTLTNARAPQPMVMRLNSTDCAEYHHSNLVPNVYQLDDYQVRTPTDIIGQHIHLVKFDVMSADGSANGWNYEDGTLSPDEVRERIEAFNHGGGFTQLDGTLTRDLEAAAHPFFTGTGPDGQNWMGARTTIQRWYADPLLERSWDGGVGTVFTHDHYGPSTHQQVGLYSTLLIEPEDSVWLDNETGKQIGFQRNDGGPSNWQAIIIDCWAGDALRLSPDEEGCRGTPDPDGNLGSPTFDAHREFYFEFADFQHAYERGGGGLTTTDNIGLPNQTGIQIPSYADFPNAINPSFRQPPKNPEDIFFHPDVCEGPGAGEASLPRPCPEAISADDPGTYALNFRNEPIGLRVFNGQLGAGAGQTPGLAGDLAFAYQSRTDRAIPEMNVQPENFLVDGEPISPYPALTSDVRPGDPWTPLLRAYMGDEVRIRVQVGAHEEEHNFTIPGLKWKMETNSPNSGWRNSHFMGIDEYFNLDVPIVPDTGPGQPNSVDYIYTVGAELEGMWNGVWGILRTYARERGDLYELPDNNVGRNGYEITNEAEFDGICPTNAQDVRFDLTAVRAIDVLDEEQGLVYNSRLTTLKGQEGGFNGSGPLIDPTALLYVRDADLTYDPVSGEPNGLKPGVPIEPLMLRVNAGDCVEVNLTNALPDDLSSTEMPGYNALPPIIHKDKNAEGLELPNGITTFNANDITPSSYVGLAPQLLAFDPRTDGGFSTGITTGKLVAPGESERFQWYAGDVTVENSGVRGNRTQFTLGAEPVEFGAVGLMPADRIKGGENGFVGAMVVEPENSCWIVDPDTRAQATVWKGATDGGGAAMVGECPSTPVNSADSFRDFIVIMQNDVNLRYGGIVNEVLDVNESGEQILGDPIDCRAWIEDVAGNLVPNPDTQLASMACAVHSIAAEGPLGAPEDPQDTGQKAINYMSDPLWFRLGITPDTPFGEIHRDGGLKDLIPNVFSNALDIGDGAVGDGQVPVFRASPDGPKYGRFRVLMPSGHARGITWTMHGHEWQRYPYLERSTEIGDNPITPYYGTQEGINPTGHWDFVVDMGGHFDVTGDYLLRDQASFGSFQGLWSLLRYEPRPPVVGDVFASVPKYSTSEPIIVATNLGVGGAQTVNIISGPAYGSIADNGDGTVSYTSTVWPACGDAFACIDEITFTATNAAGTSEVATLFVEVINTAPVAMPDVAELFSPGTTVDIPILANDFDAEGDLGRTPLTVQFFERGDNLGSAEFVGGVAQYTFTGTPGFSGVDEIEYSVTDESGAESNRAVIRVGINVDSITITRARYQENNARWQIDGTCSVPGNTISVHFGLSTMDTPLIDSGICTADQLWSVTAPNPADVTVLTTEPNYVSAISTGLGAFWGFPVQIIGANNPPTAVPDTYAGGFFNGTLSVGAPGVLANDTDADLDPLTAVLSVATSAGAVTLDPDGSFTYQPDAATYSGSDSFSYVANDGSDDSTPASVTISGPVGLADSYAMAVGAPSLEVPAESGVLANDFGGAAVASVVSPPLSGDLVLELNGAFSYTPDAGFANVDSFTYEVCNATGECSTAVASINVTAGNTPPTAGNDSYSVAAGGTLVVDAPGVLNNDSDPDPLDTLVAVLVAPTSNGTLLLSGDGAFTYTPGLNFSGVDTFTYRASDGIDQSNVATVTISVTDVVTVDSASYRIRRDRWQIQGSVSDVDSTVTLFMCTDDACNNRELIGLANVSAIDGSWNFNGTGATRPPGPDPETGDWGPAWVVAVSSSGSESAPPTPVTIRN